MLIGNVDQLHAALGLADGPADLWQLTMLMHCQVSNGGTI